MCSRDGNRGPFIPIHSSGKKMQKIHSLELAKARKILTDQQEQVRKIHKEKVKTEIENRKREREEEKNKEEALKLNSKAKKLSKDLKIVSKNLKKVSKDLNKEAFFTVCEAIVAPPVSFPISQVGESSELKETAVPSRLFEVSDELEAPALNADSISDESDPFLVRTDFEVKEVGNNSATELVKKDDTIELVKKDVKAKNGKSKREKQEEKK